MRPWLLLVMLAACTDGPVTGYATSSAHPDARSATTFVDNVVFLDPPGEYRRWTVQILEAREGTDCEAATDPVVSIELYTIFSSAPRGLIPLSLDAPPRLFPAAYATVINGVNAQGMVDITAAATTKLVGTLSGYASIDGIVRPLEIAFDAPTCDP
jgi:hypothetical protein